MGKSWRCKMTDALWLSRTLVGFVRHEQVMFHQFVSKMECGEIYIARLGPAVSRKEPQIIGHVHISGDLPLDLNFYIEN